MPWATRQRKSSIYPTHPIHTTAYYGARGSVSNIVNNAGNRVKGYDYDEYGNLTGSSGNFKNEVTYTGYVADNATGLYYANARYYNPATGRFLTQDAYTGNAGEPWTQNLYSYCGNNPINFIDPTGHCRESPRMGRKLDCHNTSCSKSIANKAERISPVGSPIVIKRYGNNIYIDAYVRIYGRGFEKALVKDGIEENWTGSFDKYRVFTRVTESWSPDGNRLKIKTEDKAGISNAGWTTQDWDGVYVGRVTLYTSRPGSPARNNAQLMRLAAHEFGHCLGIWGNANPGGEDPRDTKTIMGSRMWDDDAIGVDKINIIKMLIAQRTRKAY